MVNVDRYEVFASAVGAHERAVTTFETAARQEKIGRGQKLLKQLMRPNAQARRAPFGSWVEVIAEREGLYSLRGDFPLESTVIAEEPTLARVLIAGDFITNAPEEHPTESPLRAYDPLSWLEPRAAAIAMCFKGLISHVTSNTAVVRFRSQDFQGEHTGFSRWNEHPDDAQPFAFDGVEYMALVGMFEEALSLRQAEGRVV